MAEYRGKALCFGDNINTDYIIASRRKKDTINPDELIKYIMEDIRPGFSSLIEPGVMLAAGENFGCGSAMEVAAQIVKAAGISIIIAKSFARSYYRNAINNGVMPLEMDTSDIQEGDIISVSTSGDGIHVVNERTGRHSVLPPFAGKAGDILAAGGIIEYTQNRFAQEKKGETQ